MTYSWTGPRSAALTIRDPPDQSEDAAAPVIGCARGDLLRRSDEHLAAAGDGLPLRAETKTLARVNRGAAGREVPS